MKTIQKIFFFTLFSLLCMSHVTIAQNFKNIQKQVNKFIEGFTPKVDSFIKEEKGKQKSFEFKLTTVEEDEISKFKQDLGKLSSSTPKDSTEYKNLSTEISKSITKIDDFEGRFKKNKLKGIWYKFEELKTKLNELNKGIDAHLETLRKKTNKNNEKKENPTTLPKEEKETEKTDEKNQVSSPTETVTSQSATTEDTTEKETVVESKDTPVVEQAMPETVITKEVKKEEDSFLFEILSIGGFALAIVILAFLTQNMLKKKDELKAQTKIAQEENNKIDEKLKVIEIEKVAVQKHITTLQTENEQLKKQNVALQNSSNQGNKTIAPVVVASQVDGEKFWQADGFSNKYFFAELMLTAGPRKNFDTTIRNGDYDLGEDVAGFIIKNDKTFFWVLDGTSDSDILSRSQKGEDLILKTNDQRQEEYFSSRWLAQSISIELQKCLQHLQPTPYNAKKILKYALKATEIAWKSKVESLENSEKERIKKLLLDQAQLRCSTTVIFGILDLAGNLDVCQIGDSNVLTFPAKATPPKSKGRQFARLILDQSQRNIVVEFADFEDTWSVDFSQSNVATVLAMTDGISNQVLAWLQSQTAIDFQQEQIRTVLAQQKQKTDDDKAFCVIQIKS